MRVLFLDIDGVVNSWDWIDRNEAAGIKVNYRDFFDEEAIKCLNEVFEQTGAKFVLSSSWRLFNTLEHVQGLLNKFGFKGELIDKTPARRTYPCRRGNEIQDWLDKHPEVTDFAIVDDDGDMEHLMSKLVQTSSKSGMLKEHVAPLVALLNGGTRDSNRVPSETERSDGAKGSV